MSTISPPDLGFRGLGNDGVGTGLVAATDIVQGRTSMATEFNGTDERVVTTGNIGLSGDAEFTLAAWFKVASLGLYEGIISWGSSAAAGLTGSMVVMTNGRFGLSTAGAANGFSAAGAVVVGPWYHGVVVKTPGLISTTTTIYLNGVNVPLVAPTAIVPNITDSPVIIGGWSALGWLHGVIDDARIYSTALTGLDVADLYARSRRGATGG